MSTPTSSASSAGERDPLRRVARRREGDDRRGDERRDRRVGPEDEDPRRPQQEVHDQRDERRVQAGDRRQPRELRVRHALRHEQRREHDARDDVVAQLSARARRSSVNPGTQRPSRVTARH